MLPQFKLNKVPFISYVATKDGLCVDLQKIKAVMKMPALTDVVGVQWLQGFTQHLSFFFRCHKAFNRVNTERDNLDMGTTSAISSGHPKVNHTSRGDPALQQL